MLSDEDAARLTVESALKRIAAYREELSTVMLGMPAAAGDRLLATLDRIIGEQALSADIAEPWRQARQRDLRARVDKLQRELVELRSLRQMRDAVVQFRLDWQSGDLGPSDVEPILDRILARTEVP